ncbi:MAG: trimethylamine---corrinoid protein Co-methyltransferase [Rhodospirillaceae bacterium]|nr:trimethylamine---corrinoid protein Co-methyltransferase [Rhodospirillaceae bacterium]
MRHISVEADLRAPAIIRQPAWRKLTNPYAPIEVLDDESVERIHQASMRLLEECGLEFMDREALDILATHGAAVDYSTSRVRMDRGLVLEYVAKAPSEFTLHARNPAHNLRVGGNHVNFCLTSGPPNCSDLDHGRCPGNLADLKNLIKLGQSLNILHGLVGFPVAPIDVPVGIRHLDGHYLHVTLTDKVWGPSAIGRQRVADGIEIYRLSRGLDEAGVRREPGLASVVNTNSPLRVDGPMLEGLMTLGRWGQCAIITPFTLAGAMSPVTIAGALAQQNAEALGVIAFLQMVAPGAPCIYGGFTSNVDMKSGAPAFGTPEYVRAAMAGGQLARRYGLPYRSSNACAANALDAQAAYESEASLWGAVMGHANYVLHGAGWMEGGLVASYEKVILDAELLQGMAAFLQPDQAAAESLLFARHDREPAAMEQRANRIWKQMLADYEPPPLDPARDEAVKDFIARRKHEGGVMS